MLLNFIYWFKTRVGAVVETRASRGSNAWSLDFAFLLKHTDRLEVVVDERERRRSRLLSHNRHSVEVDELLVILVDFELVVADIFELVVISSVIAALVQHRVAEAALFLVERRETLEDAEEHSAKEYATRERDDHGLHHRHVCGDRVEISYGDEEQDAQLKHEKREYAESDRRLVYALVYFRSYVSEVDVESVDNMFKNLKFKQNN